jgi:hypothetical protein
MSIYPAPTNTNVFNEKDFNNNDNNENNDNDIIDLSNYVKKTGDSMNGKLIIPELEFYDSSIQNTAFNNTIKQNINNNTTKLSGINFINGYSEITKIKTNEIEINGINCDAFSNLDKLKIYENEGNILNHNNRITSNEINIATNASNIATNESKLEVYSNTSTDIIFNDRTLNVKDSPILDITNSLSSNNKFDGAISFLRTGSVYRKWWIGSIGDNFNPQNNFNICVNGNTPEPENIFDLSPQGDLKIKGNFLVGNNKIIFNGNEEQNQAFTNEEAILIQQNATDILNIKVKTDVIETVTTNAVYSRHQSYYRNLLTGSNVGYIGPVGDNLHIGCVGNNSLILNPNTGHIVNYCSFTYFGDNNGPGNIILQNQGNNTGSITINNEQQNNAYTDLDHSNLNQNTIDVSNLSTTVSNMDTQINTNTTVIASVINNIYNINDDKIYVRFAPNWLIFPTPFISGQNNYGLSSYIYRITNHPALNFYTNPSNGGAPRHFDYPNKKILQIKYSVAYQSTKGNIRILKSRLIKYTNVANEGTVIKAYESLFQGLDYFNNADFNNIIMYNDSLIVVLDNERESVALETEYLLTTSNGQTDCKCQIEVVEL